MDRAELERLDRESLVVRAQAAGIKRARILTRPELVDELLRLDPNVDESELRARRGFFGLARDLLNRVVERGLHLPDAADRLRAAFGAPLPDVPRPEPQAVPTLTLAEIYAAQGHKKRAIETLRRVLEREPDHAAARALLFKLEAVDYVPPAPPLPPEPEVEPAASMDDDEDDLEAVPPSDLSPASASPIEVATASDEELPPSTASSPPISRLGLPHHRDEVEVEVEVASDAPLTIEADTRRLFSPDEIPTVLRDARTPSRVLGGRDARAEREPVSGFPADSGPVAVVDELAPTSRGLLHDEGDEESDGSDECVAVPLGDGATYVWWQIRAAARDETHGLHSDADFVVRVVLVTPSWDGPRVATRDVGCDPTRGEALISELPVAAIVRVAVGWLDRGAFVPVAHSPALELDRDPALDSLRDGLRVGDGALVRWSLEGREPVLADTPGFALAIEGARRAHAQGLSA